MINTLDVTVSGHLAIGYFLPNGSFRYLDFEEYDSYWKEYPIDRRKHKTLNLINVESFVPVRVPLLDIKVVDKKVSALKRFLYDGWNDSKLYDVKISLVGVKEVTYIKMRSGESLYVDETSDCLKNAIDACVWTADSKYLV